MDRFLTIQKRGTVALPPDLRRRHHLDQPGSQVEVIERDDGVIELHPVMTVPAEQAWFWTKRWQAMEREVDEQYADGRGIVHDSGDHFLAHLNELVTDHE